MRVATEQALGVIRMHGWNATSFQALETGFVHWFAPAGDAVVAYVDTGRAWVVAGAPIAHVLRMREVAQHFEEAAQQAKRRVVYAAVEQRFLDCTQYVAVGMGEQPVWDPSQWAERTASKRSLRAQLARARNKGVQVNEVLAHALVNPQSLLPRAIETLKQEWLLSRPMPPMRFIVDVQLLGHSEERRYFLATHGTKLVGLLSAIPVYARQGWFFEDLMQSCDAPNGTAEVLIDAAMRALAQEGAPYVTMGLAPLAGDVPGWMRAIAKVGRPLYDFDGVRRFKAKLQPQRWDKIFLAMPAGVPSVVGVADLLTAFAGGSLTRFGLQALNLVPRLNQPASAPRSVV